MNKNEDKICQNEELFNNGCSNKFIEDEKIGDYYNEIKNGFINNNYKGNNTIIKTQNVVFQISKLEEQENANDPDVSSVDLGTCEEKLKSHYSIPEEQSLIIYKLDIKTADLIQTYVQYEVYEPINMNPLNLSICKDDIIKICSPVKLNNLTSALYDNLKESGYDLFNQDDPFYHDVCTVYTTENGTDMILLDRKEIIYNNNGNISLCQTGCELESYNSTNKKAICNCSPQHTETKAELSFSKDNFNVNKIKDSFVGTLKNSNFLVLKCYKLAFDIKNIGKNIGRIVMTIIVFLSFVFLIIFCLFDFGKIIHYMSSIFDFFMKNKYTKNNKKVDIDIFNNNAKDKKKDKIYDKYDKKDRADEKGKNNKKDKINEKEKKETKRNNLKKDTRNIIKNYTRKNQKSKTSIHKKEDKILTLNIKRKAKECLTTKITKQKKKEPPKRKNTNNKIKIDLHISNNCEHSSTSKSLLHDKERNKNDRKKIRGNTNIINIQNLQIKTINKDFKNENNQNKKNMHFDNYQKIIIRKNDKFSTFINKKNYNSLHIKTNGQYLQTKAIENDFKYKDLNDQELNTLEYEVAIILDKRNYFQYYWSLLKKKHLLLFTFYPNNDYNLVTVKICLFLLSFSLYFTINGFFFTDDTMHKIYEDNGAFNIIYRIPQIIYSSVVSAVINMIVKQLSLSENNILAIKREKSMKKMMENSSKIKKCLTIKFILFFILNYLFLFFFWYFISCFCAVYTNTQMILIKDTLVSFALSMVYPIGLNLLPGLFRIPALKDKKKDKKYIYKLSGFIALI